MTYRLPMWLTPMIAAIHYASPQVLQTFNDDAGGTPYTFVSCLGTPVELSPEFIDGGPTEVGRFLRIAFGEPIPNHNSITFDYVDPGAFDQVVVDFDFRMVPDEGQADGIGVALLSIAEFGETGWVCPLSVGEEPNYRASLGIGFDIHKSDADLNNNHVSIHFGGIEQAEFDVTQAVSLAGGEWIHARILVSPGASSGIEVTVILQQRGGQPFSVVEEFLLTWVEPYESRVHFAGRSGGDSACHDIDNVAVQYMDSTKSILSFSAVSYDVLETDPQALVTVTRQGNTEESVSVASCTMDGSACGGVDYLPKCERVSFGPGETSKSFTVRLLNDGVNEGDESFLVSLDSPSSGAVLGGPSMAGVRIVDDESAALLGHWSHIVSFPTVAVHLHLLPTGQVMFWQEGGAIATVYLWDPFTGAITPTALPPYDIFCAGHSFLADGRLLITGGHDGTDGNGLRKATIYNPFCDTWKKLPLMGGEGGRWYPTNTTLGSGDVLVLSGSYNADFDRNTLPQVFQAGSEDWRDLMDAQQRDPLGGGLYPRMFLTPKGMVFKVGDPETWFLDPSGSGSWCPGPPSIFQETRRYGPAVFYDGRVLLVGGAENPPTNSVELIDLNQGNARWVKVEAMEFPRRHHNATLLPDGTTLVTGGTSCRGFNCPTDAVLEAELWDGDQSWKLLASMAVKRLYHSTALLLPDGRVLSAGGGRPAAQHEVDHHNAEIFSPPYLFKGPRPTIMFAPDVVGWGQCFFLATPDAADVTKVSLISLGSVTHAFDQNARFLTLPFAQATGGLSVTVPPNPNLAPPGYYMLFILSKDGVPSVAKIILCDGINTSVDVSDAPLTIAASTQNRDLNFDGRVDLADVALFQSCFTGAAGSLAPCCEPSDFNSDDMIDLADYADFWNHLTGP